MFCKGSSRLTGMRKIVKNLLNRKDEHRMVSVERDLKDHLNIRTLLLQVVYGECQLAAVVVTVSASALLSKL